MNENQEKIFDIVKEKIDKQEQLLLMIDAPAGTGKTFVMSAIADYVRSQKGICLISAFSGVAAQLLEGGTTIHSRFKIPIDADPAKNCNFSRGTITAKLFRDCNIILMDEVAMMSRIDLERINRSLQDVLNNKKLFGGKSIVMGGDFRQILPVEKTDVESIDKCLKNSILWPKFEKEPLKINERVRRNPKEADEAYAKWLLRLGLGLTQNFCIPQISKEKENFVQIPAEMMSKANTIEEFVDELFPNIDIDEGKTIILTPINMNMHNMPDTPCPKTAVRVQGGNRAKF